MSDQEPARQPSSGGPSSGAGGEGDPAGPGAIEMRRLYLPLDEHERLRERLERRTDRSPGHGPWRDCCLWTRSTRSGYGAIKVGGQVIGTHVVSYLLAHGISELPAKVDIAHSCDVRQCLNPAHLHAVSRSSNVIDAVLKGRILIDHLRGERHHRAILTERIVAEARQRFADGETAESIARSIGVPVKSLRRAIAGETWRSVTDPPPQKRWTRTPRKVAS